MKLHIHFHSDCPFFAGCENMLAVLFNSDKFKSDFDITFSFRANAKYQEGFSCAVKKPPDNHVIKLPDIISFNDKSKNLFFPLNKIALFFAKLFFLKNIFLIFDYFKLKSFFKKIKPDILFVNNGGHPGAQSCIAAALAGKTAGIKKTIYFVNNTAIGYNKLSRWPDYPFDRILATRTDIFASASKFSAEKLGRVLKVDSSKIVNIYNGVPVLAASETIDKTKERFNIPPKRKILLTAGLLTERKGHIILLQALKKLKEEKNKVPYLIIAGEGELKEEFTNFIKKENLEDDVTLAGFEKNLYNLINVCDIYIQPSIKGEDLPNVVAMAMASGKPVICTRIAGMPEQIIYGKNGFIVEPDNAEAIKDEIMALIGDEALMADMGKESLSRFNTNFTTKAAINAYSRLFKSLIG